MAENSFDQQRRHILAAVVNDPKEKYQLVGADDVAEQLHLPPDDVEDAFELLEQQGMLKLNRTMSGPLAAWATSIGRQYLREGVAFGAPAPIVNLSNTFLAPVGTVNLAQSGTGDVFQHIEQPGNLGEIRRLLDEMKRELTASEIDDNKREEGLVYIEQLTVELQHPKPRPSMVKFPWAGLGRIADLAGVTQAGH